jgi:hypothetical protein
MWVIVFVEAWVGGLLEVEDVTVYGEVVMGITMKMDGYIDARGRMGGWTDGRTDGRTDGWKGGMVRAWSHGTLYGYTYIHTCIHTFLYYDVGDAVMMDRT